jgi:ethanolamine utilization protein EutN
MKIGRVIGSVVASKKIENLTGLKLLVVDYLNDRLESLNKSTVCIDTVSAGEGDVVLLCASSSARLTPVTKNVCTDNTIVGIIDCITVQNKHIYNGGGK